MSLRRFGLNFLDMDKEEREKQLKKYFERNDKYTGVAAYVFLNHYDKISKEVRENILLMAIKKNIEVIEKPVSGEENEFISLRGNLALNILKKYFDIIPPQIREEIIKQGMKTTGNMGKEMIAEILAQHFEQFDKDFRNKIFEELSESSNKYIQSRIANLKKLKSV